MFRRVQLAACLVLFACSTVHAQKQQMIGAPPEASNMKLVGYNDLQARSAYQPTIHHQGDRWIAYIGHHGGTDDVPNPVNPLTGQAEPNGTSIVDVTDPAHPKYLRHLPGQEGKYESGGAQMVRVCDGKSLPKGDANAVYMLRTFGSEAHEIWNVADPANPVLVTRLGGLKDTHKSWWECDTGIAYLVSGAPDWRTRRMTQVYDLSDPAHPQKVRDFGLPGQEPGATGAVPTELHGPISTGPTGNRVYFGYGTNKGGILQIVDREKLLNGGKEPTPENLRYPEIARLPMSAFNGAHTTFPMLDMPVAEFAEDKDGKTRDIVMIVDEAILNECGEARQMVWFADVTTEVRPMIVSSYTVPEASGQFCQRGGRFGSHSSNESMAPVYYKRMAFIAFFNAGVRALDIRDPYHPKEVGYFIPAITQATDKRCIPIEGGERCKVAIQTNNVETDDRGYIYIVDRANTGLHILELTGSARAVAGLPKN
ncbi:LVIVD repeat-containing protein [Bradyrhizobium sp. UFLA05-112]